jgi:hypothetical protein
MKQHPFRNHLRLRTPIMFQEKPHLQVPILVVTKWMRASLGFVVALISCLLITVNSNAESNSKNCLTPVKLLDQKRKDVDSAGGIWGIFARSSALDRHSKDAVKLDSNISKLVETLVYLCETQSGVPYNELASFIARKIKELGEEHFKREQIFLGKPKKDVEDWLEYSKIAVANKKRVLEADKINTSINGARLFINRYWKLYNDFKGQDKIDSILPVTIALNQEISEFMINDPYTSLALFEDSQIPFWDIDENYGGS